MKNQEHFINLDQLAEKYLKPESIQSLPDVDINVEEVDMKFDIKEIRFRFQAKHISVATFLVALLTLLVVLLRG